MIRCPDNQINASFIDISRIKWLVFLLWSSFFRTTSTVASSEAPADYQPEKHRRVYTSSNVCHSHEWRVDTASGLTLKKQNACLHAVRHAVGKRKKIACIHGLRSEGVKQPSYYKQTKLQSCKLSLTVNFSEESSACFWKNKPRSV